MITKEKIHSLVTELLEGSDKYLVDLSVQPGNKLFIYIDGDRNVNINDCHELNRLIESRLDRDEEDYDLTVSSYGIDRALLKPRQYHKNIGNEMEVILQDGTKLTGLLVSSDDQGIELEHPVKKPKKEEKKPNTVIPFEEIKTAKIILKFGK